MSRRRQNNAVPAVLIVLGGLLLVGAAIVLAVRGRTPAPTSAAPTAAQSGFTEETYPEIERISLEDAKAALDKGQAVFLDVRGSAAWAAEHVPGALVIPVTEIETRWRELDPNDWIITYCT